MDDPTLDADRHRHALRGLARLNRLSSTAAALFHPLRRHVQPAGKPWRLLDIACGSGDITLALHRRLQRAGLPVTVHGCDVSDTALDAARARAAGAGASDVRFFRCDVLNDPLPAGYDVMTCSLFLHHLDEPDIERLLRAMGERARLILVDDLVRSRRNWWCVWLATRLVTRSPVVHVDGPLSIQGALTVDELASLADRAGLCGASVRPRRPARMLLEWSAG